LSTTCRVQTTNGSVDWMHGLDSILAGQNRGLGCQMSVDAPVRRIIRAFRLNWRTYSPVPCQADLPPPTCPGGEADAAARNTNDFKKGPNPLRENRR
jgi:hypothetical protein